MSIAARAWTAAARLRRRRSGGTREEAVDARRAWVREHAPGRSFLDVGGLLYLDGEMAFLAEEAGAAQSTLLDPADPSGTRLPERLEGSRVRYVRGTLEHEPSLEEAGPHDVVLCTGVLYHAPDPLLQLRSLRKLTKELLYVGTQTIPEVPGLPGACVYYPHLPEPAREALASAHWDPQQAVGLGTPFDPRPDQLHANWWWGISPSALRAMLRTVGFEVVEELRGHDRPFAAELVARPVEPA